MTANAYLPYPMRIKEIIPQTDIDWTFRLESNLRPASGQFLEISLPGAGEAPISISDFSDTTIDLTIRKVGRLTNTIFQLEPGDTLYARGPYGNGFDTDICQSSNVLLVAGGTGLAPVKHYLKELADAIEPGKRYDMILGFKSPSDILFSDEIEQWRSFANITLTVDQGDDDWTGHTGLVTKYIDEFDFAPGHTRAVVVGPPMMMKFSTLSLRQRGLNAEDITVSFERKMSCGMGKCGHCKIDDTYVCLEGPVFNYSKAIALLD